MQIDFLRFKPLTKKEKIVVDMKDYVFIVEKDILLEIAKRKINVLI